MSDGTKEFWVVYFILGVLSAVLTRLFATKPRSGIRHDLQDLSMILFGPIPIIGAILIMLGKSLALRKYKKFASLTIVYYSQLKEYHLYLNEFLLVRNLTQDMFIRLLPQMRLHENFTSIETDKKEVVVNLGMLNIQEVRSVEN